MSWKITPSNLLVDDADALAYLTAVEAADTAAGQSGGLESGVRLAVNAFVKGCKADGIWPAIKASCILAGARTLQGALVPLVGAAPTSFNFVAGDYNRETGLVGDGSTKYLSSNWISNSVPDANRHVSLWVQSWNTTVENETLLGNGSPGSLGRMLISRNSTSSVTLNMQVASASTHGFAVADINATTGLLGLSRNSSSSFIFRSLGSNATVSNAATQSQANSLQFYGFGSGSTDARFAFYSAGESLALALLDSRVTTLINAIAAAIP
jgi:hypothetical protein